MISRNVGRIDRILRVVLGIVLLAFVVFVDDPIRWAGLIGIVPLLTGLVGTCPIYRILGVSTCPVSASR